MNDNKSEKVKFAKFLLRTFGGFILWICVLPVLIFAWSNIGHQINPVVFRDVPVSDTSNFIAISLITLIALIFLWLVYVMADKNK